MGAAERFVGNIHQVPPMVSALKHEGRRLYELAREGTVIEREARPVVIYELEIESVGVPPYPEVEFRVVCGKGTYIRSLADDMAAVLGGGAHLTALRRTRIGSLSLDRYGLSVDDLDTWEKNILTPAEALADLPAVAVGEAISNGVANGIHFVGGPLLSAPEGVPFRVIDESGSLLAVYQRVGDQARPEVVLAQ